MLQKFIYCLFVLMLSFSLHGDEELVNIKAAMPGKVETKKKYKILCFSKPYGFPHSSIKTAKKMIQVMGDKTGLFSVDFSEDAKDLSAENLAKYDALYLNNSTHIQKGITDPVKRKELINFVKNGGGLVAIHAATDGGWPEYVDMIGGNFDGHPWGHKGTYCLCNEDIKHPIVRKAFGGNREFKLNDELYQYKDFYRDRVRVLMSIDMSKFENHRGGRKRDDNDYPMVWIKDFGKGKVFVSSPGHNHHIYWHKDFLKIWLEGFRFVLGELKVDTSSIPKPAYALPSENNEQDPNVRFRTPDESQKLFEVQEGYSMELVADNPLVTEPVVNVWDGNGRMYVAEWRSYMQDIKGSGTNDAISQVVRLEDTDNDGIMDKKTVFAKDLVLPRMILPLIDSVLIGESNTNDIYEYKDTNNDGVADSKKIWYQGGKRGGNVEHQPSGLIWSMDNWIYSTYNSTRLRFTRAKVEVGATKGNRRQWGLTQDNTGKVIFMDAGAGIGPVHPLFPNIYTKWHPKWVMADGFRNVHPIDNIADAQGGFGSMRNDNTAKSFTATCGQSVFRGDRLPKEMVGNLFFSEPVGRLTRRAEFKVDEMGRRVLHNVYGDKEFIASKDANFRPINSATGPDGTLYIVDMHRGIVQESAWVPEGSHIYKAIKHYGLDKNVRKGRIYRIRHHDFKPGPKPNMLNETPAQLVKHLSHPNGWWRDEAQKLILLHGDQSVIPALKEVVANSKNPLARLHALWTLEGFDAISMDYLKSVFKDSDHRVRAAAIRLTEPFFQKDIKNILALKPLVKDKHYDVAIQLVLSASTKVTSETRSLVKAVMAANPDNDYLKEIDDELNKDYFAEVARKEKMAKMAAEEVELMIAGKKHFDTLCASCHGPEGKGLLSPDGKMKMAPSFVQTPTVLGSKEVITRVALHGMTGPLRGKNYMGGIMMPLKSNDDKYLASVLTYIRKSFGNNAEMITARDVAAIREETKNVTESYTEKSLKDLVLNSGGDIKLWTLRASNNDKLLKNLQDDNLKNTYANKGGLKVGEYIEAEFPHQRNVFKVILNARGGDFAAKVKVEISEDGKNWQTVADNVKGRTQTVIPFNMAIAKKVRITNLQQKTQWWQLYSLDIIGPGMGDIDQYSKTSRKYLSLKEAKSVKVGWNNAKQDRAIQGGELKIAKKRYFKGLGVHSHSEIIYDLKGKGYQRFYTKMGSNDSAHKGAMEFEIYVDGKKQFASGDMKQGEPAKFADLNIAHASELKLVVTAGSDKEPSGDHANWVDSCFIK
ncbi:MAG: ThuA domain-containing protein [Lentisphaerales bacterium]|nr:ThuA domain-containing protein [Lentisphaerales bacterium]